MSGWISTDLVLDRIRKIAKATDVKAAKRIRSPVAIAAALVDTLERVDTLLEEFEKEVIAEHRRDISLACAGCKERIETHHTGYWDGNHYWHQWCRDKEDHESGSNSGEEPAREDRESGDPHLQTREESGTPRQDGDASV